MMNALLATTLAAVTLLATTSHAQIPSPNELAGKLSAIAMCQAVAADQALNAEEVGNETLHNLWRNRIFALRSSGRLAIEAMSGVRPTTEQWQEAWFYPAVEHFVKSGGQYQRSVASECKKNFLVADRYCDQFPCPFTMD